MGNFISETTRKHNYQSLMKKSFNFTHLAVIVFGYFIFNIIVNFGRRLIFSRKTVMQASPEILREPENTIGFKTDDEPEKEVVIEKIIEENETSQEILKT